MISAAAEATLTEQTHNLRRGLRWSLFVHGAAFFAILIRSLIFPSEPIRVIPTLRVDLVALPDVLKKDIKAPSAVEEAASEEETKPTKRTKVTEETEPDQMVIKKNTPAEHAKETSTERAKKLKNTLARMKALAKINVETDDKKAEASPLLKGNKVSKGTSVSGDAKESTEEKYYDRVRNKLQDHWELPVWLSRRSYSARVRIAIDARGHVVGMTFVQPSGSSQFDDEVRKTIKESQPFPLPPHDLLSALGGTYAILVGFPL